MCSSGDGGSSHPFAHQAVVEGQPDELEGRLLDEVGVEDADLRGLPGDVVRHRLPKALRSLLRPSRAGRRERERRKGEKWDKY